MTSTITYNGRTIPITDQHGQPIELIQGETFYMAQDGSSAMVMRGNRKERRAWFAKQRREGKV